ncbi:MAG: GNAT family N-acetyltransferase [Bacteroidota bacterium]|nr:GNAT family N-acetyltransferase [Bacteroidota bacterium]
MKVIRITKNDIATVDFIVANLIDNKEELPSTSHLQKLLTDDRSYLFAVLIDEEIIGYALVYKFPSLYESNYLAYLYDIEVLATFRRKGAGRLLMKTLLAHLKSDGVSELWLGSATDNIEGQALFKSTGGIKSDETFNDFTYKLT